MDSLSHTRDIQCTNINTKDTYSVLLLADQWSHNPGGLKFDKMVKITVYRSGGCTLSNTHIHIPYNYYIKKS